MKKTIAIITLLLATIAVSAPIRSMVGARAVANTLAEAVQYSAKDYIQDGLVAMWDGIENAGWGVHDNETTNWIDLIGGIKIPLASNTWESSYLSINSAFGDALKTNSIKPIADLGQTYSLSAGFSVEYVYKRNSFIGWSGGNICLFWVFSKRASGLNELSTNSMLIRFPYGNRWGDDRFFIAWQRNNVNCATEQTSSSYIKSITRFAIVSDGLDVIGMRDGIEVGSGSVTSDGAVRYLGVNGVLESNWTTRWHYIYGGDVFCIRIYTKSLSLEELASNYKIDRVRFNIR